MLTTHESKFNRDKPLFPQFANSTFCVLRSSLVNETQGFLVHRSEKNDVNEKKTSNLM
ncbi:CLUMA_CG001547, isoform A [Clunio marinus]|uniref:CLUMA_CG001547, isoform A n=1 Tax=Clunio marinus TaxID=568069 RepID=A0A1J1HJP4_9DIPT|nr:CLUMA_CG001547, isoform A [Clunio marinus]